MTIYIMMIGKYDQFSPKNLEQKKARILRGRKMHFTRFEREDRKSVTLTICISLAEMNVPILKDPD